VDRGLAVALTAFGALIALQAPVNSRLGAAAGTIQGVLVSFVIGTVVLTVLAALAKGGLAQIGEARGLSWYWFTGGLLGAVYVSTMLVTVRTLGATGITAATIAAQLAMSVALDQFGWLGVARSPITAGKVAGVVLLGIGVWLIVRD
jgi:bacterial/archaeal transporter family-2 protein